MQSSLWISSCSCVVCSWAFAAFLAAQHAICQMTYISQSYCIQLLYSYDSPFWHNCFHFVLGIYFLNVPPNQTPRYEHAGKFESAWGLSLTLIAVLWHYDVGEVSAGPHCPRFGPGHSASRQKKMKDNPQLHFSHLDHVVLLEWQKERGVA